MAPKNGGSEDNLKWSQVAFIIMVVVQLAGCVWLVSNLASRITSMEDYIKDHKQEVRDINNQINAANISIIQLKSENIELRRRIGEM